MYEKVGSWNEILIDMSEFFHAILNFAAVMGKKPQSYLVKVPVKKTRGNQENKRTDVYLFNFEFLRLEIWHACI